MDYMDDRYILPPRGERPDAAELARAWQARFPFGLYHAPATFDPVRAMAAGQVPWGPPTWLPPPPMPPPMPATPATTAAPAGDTRRQGPDATDTQDVAASTSRAALADATLERHQVQKGPARVKRQRQFGRSTAKPATKIDTFTGGRDGVTYGDWLFRVESLIPCFTEAMVRQVILGSVGGYAAQLLRALGQDASVDLLLDRLDEAFGEVQSCHALVKALYSVTQREEEDVNEFMARIGAAVHAVQDNYPEYWTPVVAAMHEREGFFHGLRPAMRTELRAEYNSGGSYLDLVRAARVVEGERKQRDPYRRDRSHFRVGCKAASAAPEDTGERTQEVLSAKRAEMPERQSRADRIGNPSRDRSVSRGARKRQLIEEHKDCCNGNVCFYCSGCDHHVRECPKLKSDQEKYGREPGNDHAGKATGGPSPRKTTTA